MADFSTLIATLQATIKTNYRQEITGQILQDDLLAMVNVINQLKQDTLAGYAFHGAPLADGASVAVTQNTFFLVGKGTYTINGTTETAGEGISALVYDSVDNEVRNYALFAYDTTPTENSRNAITSGAVAAALAPLATKEDVEAVEQEVAQVAGEAGLAEAVIDTDGAGTEQEFTFRKSGGDGGAYYRKIKGKTMAWNQLFGNKTTPTFNISEGAGYPELAATTEAYEIISGHKYLVFAKVTLTSGTMPTPLYMTWRQTGDYQITPNVPHILTATENATIPANAGVLRVLSGSTPAAAGTCFAITADLTMFYGSEIDGMTDAQVLAKYMQEYGQFYYAHASVLKSNDAEAVETTGVNQWDEEWEVGGIDGYGSPTPNNIQFRSKNYIPVFGSTPYYIKSNTGTGIQIFQYDANHRYLDRDFVNNAIITTFENTRYLKFRTPDNNTTYNHDICINISNPAINGQYFPYWKRTLQLGITTRKDTDGNVPFADGMKGAGTASDWAYKVGGEKRMKRINLGNLNWDYYSGAGHELMIARDLVGLAKGVATSAVANLSCSIFAAATVDNLYDHREEGIGINNEGQIDIYAANMGSDPAAFKAAMQGVMLDYELATPVPFTWAEPLNLGVKVDENGTERAVAPEGATAPSAPFVADTTYTMSVARMVEKLQNL